MPTLSTSKSCGKQSFLGKALLHRIPFPQPEVPGAKTTRSESKEFPRLPRAPPLRLREWSGWQEVGGVCGGAGGGGGGGGGGCLEAGGGKLAGIVPEEKLKGLRRHTLERGEGKSPWWSKEE